MFPNHFFEILMAAISIGGLLTIYSSQISKLNIFPALHLVLSAAYFGLVGARLTFWIITPQSRGAFVGVLNPFGGGIVSWGGILGGVFGIAFWCWGYRKNIFKTLDIVAPAFFVALAIGRIGCFSQGDDHGKVVPAAYDPPISTALTDGSAYNEQGALRWDFRQQLKDAKAHPPWYALTFPPAAAVQWDMQGLPLYPTQPLMSLYNFLIAGLLFLARKKKWLKKAGSLTALGLALWGASRFGLEFYRGDIIRGVNILFGLSRGQIAGLVALVGGMLWLGFGSDMKCGCVQTKIEQSSGK